jgi:signal transduction histidine kinase
LGQPRRPADYQETLREMEEQVDRLIRLSNDLLFIARLDGGQLQRPMESIELGDFMGAVVDQMQPLAAAKSVALVEELPAGLTLRGDIDLLIRLYLNLLDNAIKFTPPGGQVTVRGEEQNGRVLVSIHDTGPGIPAEHLPHLFERFYRVEDGRMRDRDNGQGGAGLGLAIAYEIARFHGGVLTVQSEPGRGTTITAQLPQGN